MVRLETFNLSAISSVVTEQFDFNISNREALLFLVLVTFSGLLVTFSVALVTFSGLLVTFSVSLVTFSGLLSGQWQRQPHFVDIIFLMYIGGIIAQGLPCFHYLLKSGTNIVAETYHPQQFLNGAVASLSVVAVVYPFGRYSESAWIAHHNSVGSAINPHDSSQKIIAICDGVYNGFSDCLMKLSSIATNHAIEFSLLR